MQVLASSLSGNCISQWIPVLHLFAESATHGLHTRDVFKKSLEWMLLLGEPKHTRLLDLASSKFSNQCFVLGCSNDLKSPYNLADYIQEALIPGGLRSVPYLPYRFVPTDCHSQIRESTKGVV